MIYVKKIYEGAYWASFQSQEAPADYRSSSPLSAQDVLDELTQRGAKLSDVEAALNIADDEWLRG